MRLSAEELRALLLLSSRKWARESERERSKKRVVPSVKIRPLDSKTQSLSAVWADEMDNA